MLAWARSLQKNGVLGLNDRNANVIQVFNPRQYFPLVDDKLQTKQLALAAGIAVPELYGVMASQHDVHRLSSIVGRHRDFVIKPAHGTGGDGIVVVVDRNARREELYQLVDGSYIDHADIRYHVSNIIGGQYSLAGNRDSALIEYRVEPDSVFAAVTFRGVPDIRILVFQGYPVMAMIRLPTRRSHGKANLHQGAVGAGVDLAHGRTSSGVLGNDIVHEHPDSGEPICGLSIPQWEYILTLAARCYELTGLGYLGVDVVLDRSLGPLILELNARPGLNIQIANNVGLKKRLERIQHLSGEHSVEEKVALVREAFAA